MWPRSHLRVSIQLLTCQFAFADDWPVGQQLAPGKWVDDRKIKGLALPGSNQARKGRLVDALAVRGDEGRDTLR